MNLYSPNQRFCRRRSVRRALLSCAMARRCASDRLKIAPITRNADASDSAGSSSMRYRPSSYPPCVTFLLPFEESFSRPVHRYDFPCANESRVFSGPKGHFRFSSLLETRATAQRASSRREKETERERKGKGRNDVIRAVASRRLNSRSASSIDFGGGKRGSKRGGAPWNVGGTDAWREGR